MVIGKELTTKKDWAIRTFLGTLKEDLKMRKLCSVWIPRLLNDDQRKKRVESAKCVFNELNGLGDNAPSKYCVKSYRRRNLKEF